MGSGGGSISGYMRGRYLTQSAPIAAVYKSILTPFFLLLFLPPTLPQTVKPAPVHMSEASYAII